jgi:hypothetical protein
MYIIIVPLGPPSIAFAVVEIMAVEANNAAIAADLIHFVSVFILLFSL